MHTMKWLHLKNIYQAKEVRHRRVHAVLFNSQEVEEQASRFCGRQNSGFLWGRVCMNGEGAQETFCG